MKRIFPITPTYQWIDSENTLTEVAILFLRQVLLNQIKVIFA